MILALGVVLLCLVLAAPASAQDGVKHLEYSTPDGLGRALPANHARSSSAAAVSAATAAPASGWRPPGGSST
jgi:hypothetical protein